MTNPATSGAMAEENLGAFKVRRDMIVHEDNLINARLSSLLSAQSFLVTAAAILLANAKNSASPHGFYFLTLIIAYVSILLGIITDYSVAAARLAQRHVLNTTGPYERVFPFLGTDATTSDWRLCLQSHTKLTKSAGFWIAIVLPKTTAILWIPFVYYCLVQTYDRNTAAIAFVATLAIVVVAFGYIRVRVFSSDKTLGTA